MTADLLPGSPAAKTTAEDIMAAAVGQPWVDPWERSVGRVYLSQPTRNAA